AVTFERFGGPEVLTYGERAAPLPEAGEALVRVRACGVNHLDLWVRAGLPGLEPEMPHVLGNDVVGEIVALGAGVKHLSVGQKTLVNPTLSCGVCPACANGDDHLCRSYDVLGRRRNGGYAELVAVPAANCLPYPDRLSWERAAAVPLVRGRRRRAGPRWAARHMRRHDRRQGDAGREPALRPAPRAARLVDGPAVRPERRAAARGERGARAGAGLGPAARRRAPRARA